ncbi:MAG: ParB N-terminal domain-containing protein [Pirellulales bacterium]|nr:ParB N-terminal domain-containing protein [Pirellulales bacterium]
MTDNGLLTTDNRPPMHFRDRIQELRRVRASELRPNPRNWRTHPDSQRNALRGLLAEIGYADALLAHELPDGSLELIDGHLRAETTPEASVPVLVLDLSEAEADKILLTLDPLAGLAGIDTARLEELLSSVEFSSPQLDELLAGLARTAAEAERQLDPTGGDPGDVAIPESYQVVVECASEQDQQDVFERMRAAGYRCRVLTL